MKAITLKKVSTHLLPEPNYEVLLYSKKIGILYFNLTGYVGLLPTASGHVFDPGEKSLAGIKRMLAELNREWAEAEQQAADSATFQAHTFQAQQQAAFQGKLVQ